MTTILFRISFVKTILSVKLIRIRLSWSSKMSKVFVLIAALSCLLRAECFEFDIVRSLTSTKELPENLWSHVEVLGIDNAQIDKISVKVSIPASLSYSDVFIFFANDAKEVLQVHLKEKIEGIFYSKPHMLEKKMNASETKTAKNEDRVEISGDFPRSWLPKNSTKISATVSSTDGQYYNYYGIQNAALSITDLMVVEEFKQLTA